MSLLGVVEMHIVNVLKISQTERKELLQEKDKNKKSINENIMTLLGNTIT